MTVCNVGDSRVILGHRVPVRHHRYSGEEEKCPIDEEAQIISQDGQILAIPLTRDQTPYRKDERDRITLAGGEIRSIDQKDGHVQIDYNWGDMVLGEAIDVHGDPPRVWLPNKSYPGCGFTRSLGDSVAKDIGVNADPEIITRYLTVNDEILVIASDGVTEFLTNQEVINMCSSSFSPLEACEAVTKASHAKWIEHDRRSDDITIIVCFLNSTFIPTTADEIAISTDELVKSLETTYGTEMAASVTKPLADVMTDPCVSDVQSACH
jgi:serine/threonine protein phosphatase PrpC